MLLAHNRLRLLAASFEVPWREAVQDARLAWAWNEPLDDLVVWIAQRHGWCAEVVVLYLTALHRFRRSPRRGARLALSGD